MKLLNSVTIQFLLVWVTITCVFLENTNANSNDTDSDRKCTSGSKLDPILERCIQLCTTSECPELRSQDVYKVEQEVTSEVPPEEPLVHVMLPQCKNITLNDGEFQITNNGTSVTTAVGRVPYVLTDFRFVGDNNTSVEICFPLSPQLLQCQLKKLDRSSYTVLPGRTLLNRWTNDTIGIRDYYTSPKSEDILGCDEPINDKRKLRCNYIIYEPDEYRFIDDDLRLWLLATNTSIYRPEYTDTGNGTLRVCYPFSLAFTRCDLWFLELHEFRLQPDHTLLDKAHNTVYDMADYFIFPDGKAVVCSVSPDSLKSTFDFYYIHAVLYVVSAVCLFIAFIVHILVPSLNYHAKPLLCHMVCMTVMYTALAIRKFLPSIEPVTCYSLFVVTYYSSMASFFWLNVLSFDLWSIFANLQTTSMSWLLALCSCRCNDKHRFYYYALYALGLPVLFCAAAIIVDSDPKLQMAVNLYPKIPAMCWFNDRHTAYAFLYIPMFTVLIVNLALFVSTIFNLRQASRGAEVVNKKLNKQLLIVCFKLFIIMGFCWIGEAIAWTSGTNMAAYYIPDAINAIQGIIIFLIYICKPATYRLLRNKFCPKPNSDGKWTTDFNTSKGYSRKTSSSGVSMSDRDNSVRSNKKTGSGSTKSTDGRTNLKSSAHRKSPLTHTDSTTSNV